MYDTIRSSVEYSETDTVPMEVSFTSPFGADIPRVDRARAYYYPVEGAASAVIFLHGLGDRRLNHFRVYIDGLNKAGISVLLPILPYFYDRKSPQRPETTAFMKGASEDLQFKYEHAVTDVRCCIDYLQASGLKTVDIMGASFGGMIAAIAMAVDRRIRRGVLVVTGGNYEHLTWHSIATKVFRLKYEEDGECSIERCRELHLDFDAAASGMDDPENLDGYPSCFVYDPSFFAHLIDPDRVLMFTALYDPFIPRASSDDLWQRLGRPKRHMLPAGHLTSHILNKRKILGESRDFFTYQ